jgi:translation initiation factor 4G
LIFEKAVDEHKFSALYAQLCVRINQDGPNFEDPGSTTSTFRRLLLSKCQEEFESRSKATAAYDKKDGLTPEEEEERVIVKRKMLGNIKFIGELGKCGMLHESILHKCIQQLLEKKRNESVADMAEDMECLCSLIKTCGPRLDTPKAEGLMNQYFHRIKSISASSDLPRRIRFMLDEVYELRTRKWNPRRAAASEQQSMPVLLGNIRSSKVARNQRQPGLSASPPSSQTKVTADLSERSLKGQHRQHSGGSRGSPKQQERNSPWTAQLHPSGAPGSMLQQQLPPSMISGMKLSGSYPVGTGARGLISYPAYPYERSSQSNKQLVAQAGPLKRSVVVVQEKSKPNKTISKKVSKQEFAKMVDMVCNECSKTSNVEELVDLVRQSHSLSFMDSLVSSLLTNVSDTQDGLSIELLLLKLFIEGLLNEEKFIQGCDEAIDAVLADEGLEKASQLIVTTAAQLIGKERIALHAMAALFEGGRLHPQFLTILVQLKEVCTEEWLKEQLNLDKFKLKETFPGAMTVITVVCLQHTHTHTPWHADRLSLKFVCTRIVMAFQVLCKVMM